MRSINPKIYTKDYYLNFNLGSEEFKKYKGKKIHPQIKKIADYVKIRKDMRVLDIGCGRGDLCFELARKGAYVTGIDYSKDAIELANDALSYQAPSIKKRVKFINMNAKELKFKDSFFDAVVSVDVFEHLYKEELDKAIREIGRVLKENGVLIVHTATNKNYLDLTHKFFSYPLDRLIVGFYNLIMGKNYDHLPRDSRNDIHKKQHVNEPTFFYLKSLFKDHGFDGEIISIFPYKEKISIKDIVYNIFVYLYPFSKYPPLKYLFETEYICIQKIKK